MWMILFVLGILLVCWSIAIWIDQINDAVERLITKRREKYIKYWEDKGLTREEAEELLPPDLRNK